MAREAGVAIVMALGILGGASATDVCTEADWPDVDYGLVCGDCKVLVDNFNSDYNSSCTNYCRSIGLECAGAWEEDDDTCEVLSEEHCGDLSHVDSSDLICQCAPPASTAASTPDHSSDAPGPCTPVASLVVCAALLVVR